MCWATVVGLDPPRMFLPPPAGSGRVTGVYVTTRAGVLELFFKDQCEPLAVTANHPLWSITHGRWVKAGVLAAGELVATRDGAAELERVRSRVGPQEVVNLEVGRSHTFYAGENLEWAHNCPDLSRLLPHQLEAIGRVFSNYSEARQITRGANHAIEAHHLVEARHLGELGLAESRVPSVVLTREHHQYITNQLRARMPYGGRYSREQILKAYQEVYPSEWLESVSGVLR